MKKIFITGAAGFIGQALCKRIIAKGWKIRGSVRSSSQLNKLPSEVDALQVELIGPDTNLKKALEGVDTVIHLSARVHVMNECYKDSLASYQQVNVAGTKRLSSLAADSGCRRFVFMSSVKVNGKERSQPYTEMDMPMPLDPYGISKWEAEQALHKIANESGMEIVVLRAPLVYGPGVKANFLRLFKLLYYMIPLPLANVTNRRSLIYLENLLDAIVTCVNHPRAAGQTFLVSDGRDLSTPELIWRIAEAMGRKARLFSFPPSMLKTMGKIIGRSAEIDRLAGSLCVDSSKIRRMLGWKPPYTIEEGIRETAEWFLKSADYPRTIFRPYGAGTD
ncbi:MAG: hypothetical protein SRB2_00430 [Desulfobacteraceae bacterium Eth-SRB2]|nr:MAG: hypothetical protein SRB2_00430 [Desulfobacteraceae bacterium Eth-SRB2]